jgi:hypothetical protein
MSKKFVVKFVNADPDETIEVQGLETVASVVNQIRIKKQWNLGKRIRLVSGGRELFEEDSVATTSSSILHCIVTDAVPSLGKPRRPSQGLRTTVDQPQTDWMDTVDPSTVLMWIFGAVLVAVAIFYACSADSYHSTSLTMLGSMTVVYIIVFFPWFRSWTVPAYQPGFDGPPPHMAPTQPLPEFGGFDEWNYRGMDGGPIPSRPLAPMRRRDS